MGSPKALASFTREATFQPESWNPETRTIDLVWTSGARVRRIDWWSGEEFFEELATEPENIVLDRLNSGNAPFLNSHKSRDLRDQIGHVLAGTVKPLGGGRWMATVRLSEEPEDAAITNKIAKGITRNISVGYDILEYVEMKEGGKRIFRITLWEPFELSGVTVGADPVAASRAADPAGQPAPTPTPTNRGKTMDTTNQPRGGEQDQAPPVDVAAIERAAEERAATRERERIAGIRLAARKLEVPDDFVEKLVSEGTPLDKARERMLETAVARELPVHPQHAQVTGGGSDQRDHMLTGMQSWLLHRFHPDRYPLEGRGKDFVGFDLISLAREYLSEVGEFKRGMSRDEVASFALAHRGHDARGMRMSRGGAMTTSDFSTLLAATAAKVAQDAYKETPRTFLPIVRKRMLTDYKTFNVAKLSEAADLQKIGENGEYKTGHFTESGETYKLEDWGLRVAITRRVIINDDLGVFTRAPFDLARAAARKESDVVWDLVANNRAMADGKAVFHADHKNLVGAAGAGTATALGTAGIGLLRKLMRLQRGIGGKSRLAVALKYLAMPAELETVWEQLVSDRLVAATAGNATPESIRQLVPIFEPRLDDVSTTAYFGFADPMDLAGIEVAYLEGENGVVIETREGWEVDGTETRIRLAFAAGLIEHRAMAKNPGAAP